MRKVRATDRIIQGAEKIELKESDRVVAVLIKNQGTATLLTGMNSSKAINKTLPGASMPYGIEGTMLTGNLMVDFESVGTKECALTLYIDQGEVTINC